MKIGGDITKDLLLWTKKQKEIPKGWLYVGDSQERYVLGQPGLNNVLIFGANPSTATPGKDDPTIRKVRSIVGNNKYEGWIMMNLYPEISSKPELLPGIADKTMVKNNLKMVEAVVKSYHIGAVWAAWGNIIDTRLYLGKGLEDILEITGDVQWYRCGKFTAQGNPRHPLYMKTDELFQWFAVADYAMEWLD